MISSTTRSFRDLFRDLPEEIRQLARKNFKLWVQNPHHPSIHFKKAGNFWSARVGDNYRALAIAKDDRVIWFWIGSHEDYERRIRRG